MDIYHLLKFHICTEIPLFFKTTDTHSREVQKESYLWIYVLSLSMESNKRKAKVV